MYLASEIDEEAITVTKVRHGEKVQHIGDVRNISSAEVGSFINQEIWSCISMSLINPLIFRSRKDQGLVITQLKVSKTLN